MNNALKRAFIELTELAVKIEGSKRNEYNEFTGQNQQQVDRNALLNWKVRAKNLLVRHCERIRSISTRSLTSNEDLLH